MRKKAVYREMLDDGLLAELLGRALSRGGQYADVFVEWRTPTYLVMEDQRLERAVTGVEQGVGIRVIKDGRTAYAHSNDLSPSTLRELASSLADAMPGGGGGAWVDVTLVALRPTVAHLIAEPPGAVPVERKVELVRAADAAARTSSAKVRQVSVIYRDSVQRVQIATSTGGLAADERVQTVALVNVMAEEGGVMQTGYEPMGGMVGFEIFEGGAFEASARRAAERAVMMLSARRAPGGRMPVVISSEAGGTMVHEAIGHGLEADLAGQGLSRFSGMLGQEVASPLVTVVDDPTLPGRRGSFAFDDEGVPAQRTVLVRQGVLTSYMYDRLSAMREGASPTGNGRRESYRHRPIPRMTNTFISPGGSDPGEVLRLTDRGLLVKRMGGGQVNTVSGDFVFDVMEGYLIENGRAGEPVRGATLTGNGPEVLRSIDMVGTDLGFSIGTCGKDSQGAPVSDAMPTLRIPEMVVGGQV